MRVFGSTCQLLKHTFTPRHATLALHGAEAEDALARGEKRVGVAVHYQIAYERPEYLGGGGGEGIAAHKRKPKLFKDQKRVINVAGGSKWLDPKTGELSESQHAPLGRRAPPPKW